jgi:hypothetical protein
LDTISAAASSGPRRRSRDWVERVVVVDVTPAF